MIDAVAYFSCSGNSKMTAKMIADKLGLPDFDISLFNEKNAVFKNLIVVFPVHCQGLPLPVKNFLKSVNAEYYTLIATYGKANPGNALSEAEKYTNNKVIAAVYLPASHTYNNCGTEVAPLPEEIFKKIANPSYIKIPKRLKTPFAGLLPALRSRMLIKIRRKDSCVNCGVCNNICPSGAINNGKTNGKCTRCMKCVYCCPDKSIYFVKGLILKKYLAKPRFEKTIIYI